MCRIAGVFNPSATIQNMQVWVNEMCILQRHGGPDDQGIYTANKFPLVLGHRRLSIIDLTANGHQPMEYADNRFCITYNGEIYNYLELKDELKKLGCSFFTNSDTEVILAAFKTWGHHAFKKFNGMFAFALLDNQTSDIYLVRDTVGIKPLYYSLTNGLAFASEINAFKPIPYLQTKSDDWQVYLMAYGHLPEPITTLKNVQPLTKGTYLKYNLTTTKYTIDYYNSFSYVEKLSSRKECIQLAKEKLIESVNRHLIADAPIGVFLSGGLDSSILSLLASQNKNAALNTLSIYFQDEKYSEKKYQDLVQQKINSKNYQYLISEKEFNQNFTGIVNSMDLPSVDGINTWFISKLAKENGIKAVLSGIGGDELFGGYPSFNRIEQTVHLQQTPNAIFKILKKLGSRKFKRLEYLGIEGAVGRYLFLRGQFVPSEIAKYLNANESEIWQILREQPELPSIDYLSKKNQASWMEMNMYLQNQLLRDADVMSMAHGVEIRVPFLDNEFIKMAFQIQSDIKYSGKYGKQFLIDSFKDILPEPIWNRKKMGFTFPFKEWFSNSDYANYNMPNYTNLLNGTLHWSQFLTLLLLDKK